METFFDKQSGKAERTNELMEQREQSNACIESAESRQKTESQGTQELSEDELDQASGGIIGLRRHLPGEGIR